METGGRFVNWGGRPVPDMISGMNEVFRWDGRDIRELMAQIEAGATPVCFRCGRELIVALDDESLAKHKVHPGVYCPASFEKPELRNLHLWTMVELRRTDSKFWDQFKK